MSTPDTSSTGNVIELKTFAGAGLGAEDDSELPEAVREFDEVLGAILMIASMLPGLPLPANPATANMLFACGAMLIRAFRQAVAYSATRRPPISTTRSRAWPICARSSPPRPMPATRSGPAFQHCSR